jgi:hypothetical protein
VVQVATTTPAVRAFANPTRVFDLGHLIVLIGAHISDRLLEIGVATGAAVEFVVHATPAPTTS